MKANKYNYTLDVDDKVVIFNGMNKCFFDVSKKNSEKFLEILSDPDQYAEQYASFIEKMKDKGFIVDDSYDFDKEFEKKYDEAKIPRHYMIMIMPTYQCNLRCWYCVQEHQDVIMTDEVERRIKLHLDKILNPKNIDSFELSWFGGEPTMEFERMISISRYALNLCNERNITFIGVVTTNSTLLTKERIEQLKDVHIYSYQITIDGSRSMHNKVKVVDGTSAFDIALNNIKTIVEDIPKAHCTLRVNYTDKNLKPDEIVNDVNSVIPPKLRNRIEVLPQKVWQVREEKIDVNKLDELTVKTIQSGFRNSVPALGICYVDFDNFTLIYPNGLVGKCDNDDISKAKGRLDKDGNIVWKSRYKFLDNTCVNSDECKDCIYKPMCFGPCPRRREEMMETQGKVVCMFQNKDRDVIESIRKYVKSAKLCSKG